MVGSSFAHFEGKRSIRERTTLRATVCRAITAGHKNNRVKFFTPSREAKAIRHFFLVFVSNSDGLHPNSDGLHPSSDGLQTSTLVAMASQLRQVSQLTRGFLQRRPSLC